MIGLSFAWLAALARHPEGRREIQYTCILELLSKVATNCLPLIKHIREPDSEEIVEYMAQFLKAYTVKTVEGAGGFSTVAGISNYGLYPGFIAEHLLFSSSEKLYYLGLSILKNLAHRAPAETAEVVA